MKARKKELNVDFIGGQNNPLTKAEQLVISEFIKQSKIKWKKRLLVKAPKSPQSPKTRITNKVLTK